MESRQLLQELSKNPLNLKKELSLERIRSFALGGPLKLLYATERVDQKTLQALYSLAEETHVLEKMQAMQKGEIVNTSEKRPALHTAMRDFTLKTELSKLAKEEREKLKNFQKDFKGFTDLVQIGIGGSDLGPRALLKALRGYQRRRVHFLSNVDPDEVFFLLKKIKLKKTLFVSVSKSGTTLETNTNEAIIRSVLEKNGLNPQEHMIAVTAKNSPMDNPSLYRACFYMWDSVGGRFSATSMVGGVMLSYALGYKVFEAILKGAHEMDQIALEDPSKNLPLLGALLSIWNHNFLGYATTAIIPYNSSLGDFVLHLQQLEMESNGKLGSYSATAPVVWGGVGTDCQHSFFQMIHQGTEIVPLQFIGFQEPQKEDFLQSGATSQQKLLSNLFAQAIALAKGKDDANPNKTFSGNRPSHILLAKKLDPNTIGALLAYYEHKTVFEGFIWGINSFDQEGVQLGKVLANQLLDVFQKKGSFPEGEAFLQFLTT